MNIDDKINNIIELLVKVGFVQLRYGYDEEYPLRVGVGKANYNDFIILQKTLSESEKLCCRIEKQTINYGKILGDEKYNDMNINISDMNIFHIKDDINGYYFFESDLNIQKEYEIIMDELKDKFKHELRKFKIKNLIA